MGSHLVQAERAGETVVFVGGACNVITASGESDRNTTRDPLHSLLDAASVAYFDPQIHPVTHGREYDYDVDGPAEKAARAAAKAHLYQVGDDTMAGVTMAEIGCDIGAGKNVVVWFSGKTDDRGRPEFDPKGIKLGFGASKAAHAHAAQYVKQGTSMRRETMAFYADRPNIRFVTSLEGAVAALREFGIQI